MKKPKTVIDAEAALSAKAAEVTAAKEALRRLEAEHGAAHFALIDAQTAADASLPQCRVVCVRRYGGAEEGGALHVILRRTPGGMLVVRRVGDATGVEWKFKWALHANVFRQAEKAGWFSDWSELREVPAAYMPQTAQAA